ncbi:MAG: hypothetical protein LIO97_03350 [Tannerellaceae bacterium]|nr:hypothetical protein [Tannerellaceae bacterium]
MPYAGPFFIYLAEELLSDGKGTANYEFVHQLKSTTHIDFIPIIITYNQTMLPNKKMDIKRG